MANQKRENRKLVMVGLAIAIIFVILGTFVFTYAFETFDLKAEELGAVEQPIYEAPFPDYSIAGSDNQWVTLFVGITATLLLFVAGIVTAKLIRKKKGKRQ